jgi:hypothetical protein
MEQRRKEIVKTIEKELKNRLSAFAKSYKVP